MKNKDNKKNFNVTNPKYGLMQLITSTKQSCSYYDPLGDWCSITKCLQCPNSEYKIIFDNHLVLKTEKFDNIKESNIEYFVIKVCDMVHGDMYEYLSNSNSDYEIIRLPDKTVMKYTKRQFYKKYGFYPVSSNNKSKYDNKRKLLFLQANELEKKTNKRN